MQEMAESYRGSHEVVVRKSEENIGTLAHVIEVARIASGKILVVAAGDDISEPNRCRRLFDALQEPRTVRAVCSSLALMDKMRDI